MRRVFAGIFLVGSIEQAACQAPTPPAKAGISDQVRIDSLQTRTRDDNNGIASFAIANETEKQINSLELTCWIDNNRARGTKVLVWPKGPILPHKTMQFSNINIGVVGESKAECEVTAAE